MNELIKIENGAALLDPETAERIAEFEAAAKRIKDRSDALKAEILKEMEAKGVIKLETPEMIISYIAPTDRETFKSKEFRADHPQMYDEYVKMSPVKASVRIKLK